MGSVDESADPDIDELEEGEVAQPGPSTVRTRSAKAASDKSNELPDVLLPKRCRGQAKKTDDATPAATPPMTPTKQTPNNGTPDQPVVQKSKVRSPTQPPPTPPLPTPKKGGPAKRCTSIKKKADPNVTLAELQAILPKQHSQMGPSQAHPGPIWGPTLPNWGPTGAHIECCLG